ncbi:MAG: patatin [Thalassobium sp.]|nr:MAG: patatin [Thalassobium sp.]
MKRINLGLQGGGAHGAFTWGVLDRVLQDDRIEIAAISGTSAGALNGAALKAGMIENGRDGARANLDWLWKQVGAISAPGFTDWVAAFGPATPFMAQALAYSPAYAAFDAASRMFSPYVFGAVFANPLERIVEQFHYDAVCDQDGPELHICATNVRSGKIRVFAGHEISANAILASACLPTLFRAVEFDDPATGKSEAFWDGGYTGNPALFPLFARHLPDDILVVNINPLVRDTVPTDPQTIQNRINEISFNSSLLRELRAIEFVQRLIADGKVEQGQMKRVLVHMIADDMLMNDLNVATKTLATPVVLARLKAAGQAAADAFLASHFDDLNERETIDLRAMFS